MAADWYVRSGATGTGTGADWTNAKTTLAAAATASAAGDRIFVSEDHAESSTSAITVVFPGTPTNPTQCYCVNHSGTVPPVVGDLRTTATVSCGAGNVTLGLSGSAIVYGITFNGGTNNNGACFISISGTIGNRMFFYNCAFVLRTANASGALVCGPAALSGAASEVFMQDTSVTVQNTATYGIDIHCIFTWKNSVFAGNPTNIFIPRLTAAYFMVTVEACDLSTCTGTIFKHTNVGFGRVVIKDCKLNASATLGDTNVSTCATIDNIRSDSGSTNYVLKRHNFFGDLTPETTIVRTGGATDGVTAHAWKIVTTANCSYAVGHFECPPMTIWNDIVSGTITVTIFGIAAAIPYNDELWAEAYCLVDSSYPLGGLVSGQMVPLDTHAQWTSDGSAWGGSVAPFSMALTLSPRKKGLIHIYMKAAKASQTYYIDPRPVITSAPAVSRSTLGTNELFSGVARSRIGIGM